MSFSSSRLTYSSSSSSAGGGQDSPSSSNRAGNRYFRGSLDDLPSRVDRYSATERLRARRERNATGPSSAPVRREGSTGSDYTDLRGTRTSPRAPPRRRTTYSSEEGDDDLAPPPPQEMPPRRRVVSSIETSEVTVPHQRRRLFSSEEDTDKRHDVMKQRITTNTDVAKQFVSPDVPGYVGFANLPNQVHRKSVKKGFEFTLMVVGESGLGKSTLVNSLFLTDLYIDRQVPKASERGEKTVKIEASSVDIEERGVKLRLTVVDTPGFADAINNEECFKSVIKYIDDQYERYLHDESGLNRRNIIDNRVHCCFYFINPAAHGLKPLDVEFMKAVDHKVNIVPVIAKSDTLTKAECLKLKQKVMDQIKKNGIQIYAMPEVDTDEDEDYKEQCKQLKAAVPFAVVGSSTVIEIRGRKVRGRMYPWGVVEVENPDHCDFIKLRTMLITHMQDLQEVTHEIHYENFRSEKLQGSATPASARKRAMRRSDIEKEEKLTEKEKELAAKDMELRRMQEMIAKMQAEMHQQNPGAKPGGPPPLPPTGPNPNVRTATLPVNGSARPPVNGHAPSHANTMKSNPQRV